ncbi:FHA domain-containing protein FhaB/FipA [Leucobacter luti]|uniref:Type III secretion system (T3SS) inner membrane Yop/YscD-like protein n=1 Tax=Leucobacter luti TaxID=340320 RepID=A0A4Q7U2R1_9MICO|nr:FHA domain-containing protein [Leucobacter luti]MBL3699525.1 FHA domain-containing protein [Leucobacter luti]RZT67037.1 type III secretion system (T3SS) inner membrane Yop/YscD-like protein [Leucobacter luti]
MSELTLLILRIGFLLLLWLFIFAIVYALRSDLFGAPVRRLRGETGGGSAGAAPLVVSAQSPAPAPAPAQVTAPAPHAPVITPSGGALPTAGVTGHGGAAGTLAITSGVAAGTTIALDEDFVTIGRSGDSTLVIVDEYTSTYHARLARSGDHWVLTDLDSTNGTRVNGERVTKPITLPPYTPVTIGTTTFELRP